MKVLDKNISAIEAQFQTLIGSTFAAEPEWLKEKRKASLSSFLATGVPDRKNEFYKYADLHKVFAGTYSLLHNDKVQAVNIPDPVTPDALRLIFVNGWLYKDSLLSAQLPKGIVIGNLATDGILKHDELLKGLFYETKDAIEYLNQSVWTDGLLLSLPDGCKLEQPVEVLHLCTGPGINLSCPRHLIVAGKNSSARIVERFISNGVENTALVNSSSVLRLNEGAEVSYYRYSDNCRNTFVISNMNVVQKAGSSFDTINFSLHTDWIRNNLRIDINGENCHSSLNGLFMTGGNEFVDNHTSVHHNEPHCESHQLYKGILNGKSTGVFNGRIYVKRDAQKTNAYQSSKNILLSDDASVNAKPELEIYADDVKCSHGSSTGKIDEAGLFYLRSRGLSEESARRLLLSAYAADVINTVKIDSFKDYLEEVIQNYLAGDK